MESEGTRMKSAPSESTVTKFQVVCSTDDTTIAEPVATVPASIGLAQLASDSTTALASNLAETGIVASESAVMHLEKDLYGDIGVEGLKSLIDVDQASTYLSSGLMDVLEREITLARKDIADIIQHQEVVIESIQHENAKFSDDALRTLEKQMAKVQQYIGKLARIRKDMTHINEQTADLKRRAARLVMQHQKRLVDTEEQRRRDEERDRRLVAQPAKAATSESLQLPTHRPPGEGSAPIGLQQPRT